MSLYLDLGEVTPVDRLFLLVQDSHQVNVELYCGTPGRWQPKGQISQSGAWRSWAEGRFQCESRYIRLLFKGTFATLGEVAVFFQDQKREIHKVVAQTPSPGVQALADEQEFITGPPTYLNGTYFDEVYFVRTAQEHLNLQEPFEWTHPPLGKLIIGGGILLLGPRPFAWRLPGVLLATAMIPLVYLLARRMFRTARAGLFAAFLLTFDFMHFAEARLGTGETSVLFFVILLFYFFYGYYRGGSYAPRVASNPASVQSTWRRWGLGWSSRERDLFLSLLFFGLGFSTKWVIFNSFLGLFLLLLWLKWRERLSLPEILAFGGGLGAAGVVYLFSYIPYLKAGHGLGDLLGLQFSMYSYHAGLKAHHPFGSPWWSWPFLLKPLWMYSGQLDGLRSMIVTLGNPALWWAGLPFILLTLWLLIKERDGNAAFIVIPFFAQWFMFIPISRVLFIYHFFPNVLFMVLAATLWLERIWERWPWAVSVYLGLNALLFVLLYPVFSGLPMPAWYWDTLRGLLFWVF